MSLRHSSLPSPTTAPPGHGLQLALPAMVKHFSETWWHPQQMSIKDVG